jgi:hypothetical protein
VVLDKRTNDLRFIEHFLDADRVHADLPVTSLLSIPGRPADAHE